MDIIVELPTARLDVSQPPEKCPRPARVDLGGLLQLRYDCLVCGLSEQFRSQLQRFHLLRRLG
jgi:hypothetical protein